MTNDHDDHPDNKNARQAGRDSNPFGGKQRHEPVFGGFDEEEDDAYEEPDRDTDYASGYREDSLDEEEYDDIELDEDIGVDEDEDESVIAPGQIEWPEPLTADTADEPDRETGEDPDDWANEEYPDEDNGAGPWPLGLIAVAVVALLLLTAGGYGVMQQRSATQEEIRQLQATLATAASPADVTASRNALQEIKARNAELRATAEALTLENRRLTDTVAGLESRLEIQEAAIAKQAAEAAAAQPASPVKATSKPAAPQPAAPKPTTAVSAGASWFVNFGSYGQRAAAQNWATRLQPTAGKVIVATGAKDGKTFYRVRVVELASRESADKVARQLESEYGLSKLWIGSQ